METFNKDTTSSELLNLINEWESPILSYYLGFDESKKGFDNYIKTLLPARKIQYLYAESDSLDFKTRELTIPMECDGYDSEADKDWQEFRKKVYYEYSIGNNQPISYFRELIEKAFEHTLWDLKRDIHIGKEDDIEFGDPLPEVAKKVFDWVLAKVNVDTIDLINAKKYIEGIIQSEVVAPTLETTNNQQKLIWKGKPAHLALIIDLLIEKGYLEATPYGERTARILLDFLTIKGYKNDVEGLGKLLHKDKFPISDMTAIDRFYKIPARNELK